MLQLNGTSPSQSVRDETWHRRHGHRSASSPRGALSPSGVRSSFDLHQSGRAAFLVDDADSPRPRHLVLVDGRVTGRATADLQRQRFLDLFISIVALIVFLVPMVVIAFLVKCSSAGPVFFRQDRPGRYGETFSIWKFRTMTNGTHAELAADEASHAAYRDNDFKLLATDPRITRIGRLLRKTSLDELPQLFNVLLGEMSIVGVRPLLPEQLLLRPEYDQQLYRQMRPGMTGLWQVQGRSSVRKADRLALDRRYLEHWSVASDIEIVLQTPAALLRVAHAH